MNKLSVNLQNCYGISKFEHEFDFSNNLRTHLVYAPNGAMKSSFARVFSKYQHGKENEIKDRIFYREHDHKITIDDKQIEKEEIFVIKPYEDSFYAQNISKILLKEEYKEEYEQIVQDLKGDKRNFLLHLQQKYFEYVQKAGDDLASPDVKIINAKASPGSIEELFVELFLEKDYNSEFDFYETVLLLKEKYPKRKKDNGYSSIKYGVIFNDKTEGDKGFLSTPGNRSSLRKYVDRYKELIGESKYFNLNFTHINAEKTIKQLKGVHYFEAQNIRGESVVENGFQLYNKQEGVREQKEKEELEAEVKFLKQQLFDDPEFSKYLAEIDGALDKNKVTKKLKDYILKEEIDLGFLSQLGQDNLKRVKEDLVYSYLNDSEEKFQIFTSKTELAYKKIYKLLQRVQQDKTTSWHQAVAEFNNRFKVPFQVSVSDADTEKILTGASDLPSLHYKFCKICGANVNRVCNHDVEEMVEVSESKLVDEHEDSVLSQGERRAFYLLNIIFEIRYRRENNIPTLFIIDDIADSFDYQNKYAIVEYLCEISDESFFRSIILTHNFDFFRTLRGRLDKGQEGAWFYLAQKNAEDLQLIPQDKHFVEPFKNWQIKLTDCKEKDIKYVYAVILMMRNILSYSGMYPKQYKILNNLVHGREKDFENIGMQKVLKLLHEIGLDKVVFDVSFRDKKYLECLTETVEISIQKDVLDLEDMVTISLFIRTVTERYLRKVLILKETTSTPLWRLLNDAESELDAQPYEILKRVNLITPEHIHINSFMYEPLIDMDKNQIIDLYEKVRVIVDPK